MLNVFKNRKPKYKLFKDLGWSVKNILTLNQIVKIDSNFKSKYLKRFKVYANLFLKFQLYVKFQL